METRTLSSGEAFNLLAEEFSRLTHIASPREHAAFVLEVVAGLKREDITLEPQEKLSPEILAHLDRILAETRSGKPLAYALGEWYFAGRTFSVNESVLIPRPDTETLCRASLDFCRNRSGTLHILEAGVGSGVCIITLGLELIERQTELAGTDISRNALHIAKTNARKHGVELELLHGSLLEPLPTDSRFDLILSNPPYVADKDEVDDSVRRYEPSEAYRVPAGRPGTYFHHLLAENAGAFLNAGGMLALEVGYNQVDEVTQLLVGNGYKHIAVMPDLSGVQRVVSAIWPG